MPKIIYPTTEKGCMLLLTPAELDNICEIAIVKHASISEIIEACFVIGSLKMTESLNCPNVPA